MRTSLVPRSGGLPPNPRLCGRPSTKSVDEIFSQYYDRDNVEGTVASTHEYVGPSVRGYKCDPKILPSCPIAPKRGIPVARFVSDPRLCATRRKVFDQ